MPRYITTAQEAADFFRVSLRTWERWVGERGLRKYLRKHNCLLPYGKLMTGGEKLAAAAEDWMRNGAGRAENGGAQSSNTVV